MKNADTLAKNAHQAGPTLLPKMKTLLVLLLANATATSFAAESEVFPLWPGMAADHQRPSVPKCEQKLHSSYALTHLFSARQLGTALALN